MSDQFKAGQSAGQAEVKKDELVDKASSACQDGMAKAGGMLQQGGDQMKSTAQGSADAVKDTLQGLAGNDASSK